MSHFFSTDRCLTVLIFLFFLFRINGNCQVVENKTLTDKGFVIIHKIEIAGNKITRPKIILREIRFHEGDTLHMSSLPMLLNKSRENIFNTGLFNFVTIDTNRTALSPLYLDVKINVIERWYIWPWPFFEISDRNFNSWLETSDFSRLTYGVDVSFFNMRGRNETLKFPIHYGFNQKYGLNYRIPFINKKQTIGISFGGDYERNHEVIGSCNKNKPVYFKDPQTYPREKIYGFMELELRPSFYAHHTFRAAYNQYYFSDTLLETVPDYSMNGLNTVSYYSLYYQYKNDHRDVKFYPLKGFYFDAELNQNGLFGDVVNELFVKSNLRKYWQLSKRWYLASGILAKVTLSADPPYFMQRGLGFGREFVRGYEYYVIDGRNFVVLKNNLKFAILPQRVAMLGFLKSKKFNTVPYALYMNVLFDGGYVYNYALQPQNDLQNSMLIGYGAGLDFTTYYDIVLRAELTMNGMGEPGIYLHFMAPL
jgi:outer membrane protein assembly factor BamA